MLFQTKKNCNGDWFYDIYDGSLYRNDAYFFGKEYTTADLVTFSEEILNEKLHFLSSVCDYFEYQSGFSVHTNKTRFINRQ